jgi:hypothetical protein
MGQLDSYGGYIFYSNNNTITWRLFFVVNLKQESNSELFVHPMFFFSGARLSLTNIQALSKLYPTKEESAKISKVIKERILQVATEKTTEKVERLVWDKPEALFIALGKIPSCTLRLACWSKTRFEWFVVSIFARLTLYFVWTRCTIGVRRKNQ